MKETHVPVIVSALLKRTAREGGIVASCRIGSRVNEAHDCSSAKGERLKDVTVSAAVKGGDGEYAAGMNNTRQFLNQDQKTKVKSLQH